MSQDDKQLAVLPTMSGADLKSSHQEIKRFVQSTLKKTNTGEGGDYGIIPYTKKMSLLKPGAEKLAKLFGLVPSYECMAKVEDWDKRFVFYKYKCTLTHYASGKIVGDAIRSCNNKEKKHAAKDVYDVANTIESVAQKRALVAAVVQATMASDIFDADIEDPEKDSEAPKRSVTQDEDPKRIRVLSNFFRDGEDRGFTEDQLKRGLYKQHSVDSLKDISTANIEAYYDKLIKIYRSVGKGNKPEKFDLPDGTDGGKQPEADHSASEPIEGEVLPNYCRNEKKHGKDNKVIVHHDEGGEYQNPYFCDKDCENAYYPPKSKSKLEELLEKGRANKDSAPEE